MSFCHYPRVETRGYRIYPLRGFCPARLKDKSGDMKKKTGWAVFAHLFVFLTPCPVILSEAKDLVILQKAVKGKCV